MLGHWGTKRQPGCEPQLGCLDCVASLSPICKITTAMESSLRTVGLLGGVTELTRVRCPIRVRDCHNKTARSTDQLNTPAWVYVFWGFNQIRSIKGFLPLLSFSLKRKNKKGKHCFSGKRTSFPCTQRKRCDLRWSPRDPGDTHITGDHKESSPLASTTPSKSPLFCVLLLMGTSYDQKRR